MRCGALGGTVVGMVCFVCFSDAKGSGQGGLRAVDTLIRVCGWRLGGWRCEMVDGGCALGRYGDMAWYCGLPLCGIAFTVALLRLFLPFFFLSELGKCGSGWCEEIGTCAHGWKWCSHPCPSNALLRTRLVRVMICFVFGSYSQPRAAVDHKPGCLALITDEWKVVDASRQQQGSFANEKSYTRTRKWVQVDNKHAYHPWTRTPITKGDR